MGTESLLLPLLCLTLLLQLPSAPPPPQTLTVPQIDVHSGHPFWTLCVISLHSYKHLHTILVLGLLLRREYFHANYWCVIILKKCIPLQDNVIENYSILVSFLSHNYIYNHNTVLSMQMYKCISRFGCFWFLLKECFLVH